MGMIGRYQQKNMTACVETQNSSSFFFILVINLRKEAYLMFCHYVENLKKTHLLHVYQKDAINHSANERRQRSPQVLVH